MNIGTVDSYLRDGCGRCDNYQTPACKVHLWAKPLPLLRELLLAAGLEEQLKWGSPTYSLNGKNVVMLVSLKEYCALQFFKGALLEDPDGLLTSAGPNSHHTRALRFTSAAEVTKHKAHAKRFIAQAIELEREGKKIEKRTEPDPLPDELAKRLKTDAALRKAFEALTPGRQRSHVLHISGAKQAETRERRVEACAKAIFAGRGFNER